MISVDAKLEDFIRFCIKRCGSSWPAIYDEMVNVAGQRIFNGLGHDELKQMGLPLTMSNLDKIMQLIEQITGEKIDSQ